MKKLVFLLIIACCSIQTYGQERLYPLQYNPVLKKDSSPLEKGFQQDYTFICDQVPQISITVSDVVNATCKEADGSFTVNIVNAPADYTFMISSPLVDAQTSGMITSSSFTFTGLEAAPYFITVIDGDGQMYDFPFGLDNVDVVPIDPDNWGLDKSFCNAPGRIFQGFSSSLQDFEVFDLSNDSRGEFEPGVSAISLETGTYYLRAKSAVSSKCFGYWIFDIEEEITIKLPFFEDFSSSLGLPDDNFWADDFAYINRSYGAEPISIGVATLDGFDQFGQPYAPIETGTGLARSDTADYLTSRPFCIADFEAADSVYLSFFYQPQGLGDYPNEGDDLYLQFKAENGEWFTIDTIVAPGYDGLVELENISTDIEAIPYRSEFPFFQVLYKMDADTLLYDGFQFRFWNKATLSGNNDHWNLDYFFMGENRTADDTTYPDVPLVYEIPSMLANYREMPWSHFYDFQDTELDSVKNLTLRDGEGTAERRYSFSHTEICSEELIADPRENILIESELVGIITSKNIVYPEIIENYGDSVVIETQVSLINSDDDFELNDEAYHYQRFFNHFAYDDGTSEVAYGLWGDEAELAYQFHLNHDDVLRGVQFSFVNMNADISELEFTVMAWDKITARTNNSNVIADFDACVQFNSTDTTCATSVSPLILEGRDNFYTYTFDKPVNVSAGTFYVGFKQRFEDFLNVGFDRNTDVHDKVFYNVDGEWLPSIIPGAIMIRPVFGGEFKPEDINAKPVFTEHIRVYPNPTDDKLFIETDNEQVPHFVMVYDYAGRLIINEALATNILDVNHLIPGMYLIKVFDPEMLSLGTQKFVKE